MLSEEMQSHADEAWEVWKHFRTKRAHIQGAEGNHQLNAESCALLTVAAMESLGAKMTWRSATQPPAVRYDL